MDQWAYRTVRVHWERRDPVTQTGAGDWVARFGDFEWIGWDQILNNLSDEGWDIFNVVMDSLIQGQVNSYRIFGKRPR
jgi:hypothetical protein